MTTSSPPLNLLKLHLSSHTWISCIAGRLCPLSHQGSLHKVYLAPLHKIASCIIYYACNFHLFLVTRMYAPKSRSLCQFICCCISGVRNSLSVQFKHSVVSNSLWPHEPQHTRSPCPSPTPGVYPNPCPLSRWCHPTISSSVVSFSSCPQSFPTSGSSQMSQLFASDGQSIGVSASTSALPMNTQDWLIEFCQENALVIENNHFQKQKRRLYTWTSPDGQHQNQIDYILCSQSWRSSLYSQQNQDQQNQDQELTVAQIMNSLLPNSDWNWRKWGKPLDHSGMT